VTGQGEFGRGDLIKERTQPPRSENFIQLSGGWRSDGLPAPWISKGRLVIWRIVGVVLGLGFRTILGEYLFIGSKSCAGTHTTNMAFGGPNGTTLHIMEAGGGSGSGFDSRNSTFAGKTRTFGPVLKEAAVFVQRRNDCS